MANFRLPDTMDSPKPLLDTIWIPRQIVIHHQVSTLKVDSFTGSISREKHLNFGIVPEPFLRAHPVFTAHPTMNHNDSPRPTEEGRDLAFEVIQSVTVLREDNQLLGRRRYNGCRLNRGVLTTLLWKPGT